MEQRTWAECSKSALSGNIRIARQRLSGTKLLGIVKANAYGHGCVQTARVFESEGAEYLGVTDINEAVTLREAGIKSPVLLFGLTAAGEAELLLRHKLTQTVADIDGAKALSEAAVSRSAVIRCHMKVDTGMGRLGFTDIREAAAALSLPGLEFEGLYTHFAVSDTSGGSEYTASQLERFNNFTAALGRDKFRLLHASNSGAAERYPESHFNMARPGIALYGYPAYEDNKDGFLPVMELKTRIMQIKELKRGESVSYGRKFTAMSDMKIAVLPIGYADGLARSLGGRFSMLLHGKIIPQIGAICMDMCMVDITGVPEAKPGDIVTVFGRQEGHTARDMARLRDTIPYEVLCNISERVPRVWV